MNDKHSFSNEALGTGIRTNAHPETCAAHTGQVISFMTIFVIILAGFTLANLLAFGGDLAAYRTYEFTFYTLYRSLLGADYFDEMYEVGWLIV